MSTLAPGMLRGDSGEFQWAMASLNVAHATGYPLLTLLGFSWLQVPFSGTVAWRLNLLSPFFGALAVATLFVLVRGLTRRIDAAVVAALFFAVAPVIWFNASILEVYTLNAFFLAIILYLLWRWAKPQNTDSASQSSDVPLYLASLILGLALAHHRLMVLTIPAFLVFLWLTDHKFFFNLRRLALLILLMIPGLLLYIYVPMRLLPTGASFNYALFDIILGREYSGSFLQEIHPQQVLGEIPFNNFHLGLAIALIGVIALFRRNRNYDLLLVLVYVATVLFSFLYSVPDPQVFLTPSFVVLAIWIGVGAVFIIEWCSARFEGRNSKIAALAAATGLIVLGVFNALRYQEVNAAVSEEAGTAEARARTILASNLPAGALLELDWETATAIRFLQTTEGLRPDLEARLIKLDERDEFWRVLGSVDAGRPVFVESGVKWERAPIGYAVGPATNDLAVLKPTQLQIQPLGEPINERIELAGMSQTPTQLSLFWNISKPPDRDVATYVHYFDQWGKPLGQEDRAACCESLYGYRSTEWEAGRTMADSFRAIPPEVVYAQIGMYTTENNDIEPYGKTIALQLKPIKPAQEAKPLGVQFGNNIVADNYELASTPDGLNLTLCWEARAPVKRDLTVFAHLLDANGNILEQADREPLDGIFSTSSWKTGEIVCDRYLFPNGPKGKQISFGLYDPTTGQRLGRADGNGDSALLKLNN